MVSLWNKLRKSEYSLPFFATVTAGLLTHMCVFVNKFPNSDAMTNFYFDQNMVTSGRWFLMPACGISSFYDLNWIIGVLSILYLAVAAVLLTRFWEIKSRAGQIIIPVLLVTFPAVTATAAYLYTMDGYMIGLVLSILAVFLAKKYKWGFAAGAVCLAFSMGIYQAYLAVSVLLCMFSVIGLLGKREEIKKVAVCGLKYLAMGCLGGVLYFVILKICLALQHKELDTYQGLNEIGKPSFAQIPGRIGKAYYDFFAFVFKGNIFAYNGFSAVIVVLLSLVFFAAAILLLIRSKAVKDWYRLLLILGMVLLIPVGCNIILLMSQEAYYHLLMRMQWVLFPLAGVVLLDRILEGKDWSQTSRIVQGLVISGFLLACVLGYQFAVCDNIAYFNMNERYEKTYAYCLRLLDRIEQTPGYEPGMPIAMIGVVNENNYPDTDITGEYTARISGTNGSILLYNSIQYSEFMKHYLNFTFEPIVGDKMVEIYHSKEYKELDSFPSLNSMKVVDGILYVKTE